MGWTDTVNLFNNYPKTNPLEAVSRSQYLAQPSQTEQVVGSYNQETMRYLDTATSGSVHKHGLGGSNFNLCYMA